MDAHSVPYLPPCLLSWRSLHHSCDSRVLQFVVRALLLSYSSTDLNYIAYSFLNPQKEHAKLAGWIIGIAVAGVVIFAITRTLIVLRERFFARWARGRGHSEGESIHSEQIDDWETVERPNSTFVTGNAV